MKYKSEEVKKIIAQVLEVSEENITGDSDFINDLEADSLKALELLAALENEYSIEIPESELKNMTSLNNTLNVLEQI